VDADKSNDQLGDFVRHHSEMLADQKESFAKLIALQAQIVANQERDIAMRRKLFRLMGVLLVVYIVLAVVPIWMRW
jgi:hypothetical protein